MSQIIPLTSDGSAKTVVKTYAGLLTFVTRFNTLDNVWLLDIFDATGVAIIEGMALVPGAKNLARGIGDELYGYSFNVYCTDSNANRTSDTLGRTGFLVIYDQDEATLDEWPDALSQFPPDTFSAIDPNETFIVLIVTPETITVPSTGGNAYFSVYCSAAWSVSCDNPVFSFNPQSGSAGTTTVTVTAPENTGTNISATITITSFYKTDTVTVNQGSAVDYVIADPNSLLFFKDGENKNVSIQSNGAWTAACSNTAFGFSPISGTGDATILVTAPENTGDSRSGILTFTCGTDTDTVTLQQDPATSSASLSPTSKNFVAAGGTQEFLLSANGSWTASTSGTGFSVDKTSGFGNDTLTVTAAENTGGSRSGTLDVVRGTATPQATLTQDAGTSGDCVPSGEGVPASVCYNGATYAYYTYFGGDATYGDGGIESSISYVSGVWYADSGSGPVITGVACGDCP